METRRLLACNQIQLDVAGRLEIEGSLSSEVAIVSYLDGNTIQVQLESQGQVDTCNFARNGVAEIRFDGGGGNDQFVNATNLPAIGYGGDGDDSLIGGTAADHLDGGRGNDHIEGGAGDDELIGGGDDDLIRGGVGNDYLAGQAGDDSLFGEAGDDKLVGNNGDDLMDGGDGNDELSGGDGIDNLVGGAGEDYLAGDGNDDSLSGGSGDDILIGGGGNDMLIGGVGDDEMDGQAGDDLLYGDGGNDHLYGGFGDDRIEAGAGDDVVLGSDGNDQLFGNAGNDTIEGERGDDQLDGGAGNDVLVGGADDDTLSGGADDDQIDGNGGDDILTGGGGDDHLNGGNGLDQLQGDSGNDTLVGGEDHDVLQGGSGDDTLQGHGGHDTLWGDAGDDHLDGGGDHDYLVGGEGDDFLDGAAGSDLVLGFGGNDVLRGGYGSDWLDGGDGDDDINGSVDNDTLRGGAGHDLLDGEAGADVLDGGDGDDQLYGGSDDDFITGGNGTDLIDGQHGEDILVGGNGDDVLRGGDNNDRLHAGAGDDLLEGGADDDLLMGEQGNDQLDGESGNDLLAGHDGNDLLDGGGGNDVLFGGMGLDSLLGAAGEDLLIGGTVTHSSDTALLEAILDQWSAPLPYDVRVQILESNLFHAFLKAEQTVFDDGVADEVSGASDRDWFFLTGSTPIYSPLANSASSSGARHHAGNVASEVPALEGFDLLDSLDHFNDHGSSELIHSVFPHASDPVKRVEHVAKFELVRYDQVTHYAVQSGAYDDPATWHDGQVPADGAHVLIPIDVAVTVRGTIQNAPKTVRVDGTLRFATDVDSELTVDTMVVTASGNFEMGTPKNPIAADVTAKLIIADNGPIDRDWDPFGMSRGIITHGTVSIHGAATSSFATTAVYPEAGDSVLVLSEAPTNWQVGDEVVLAGTNNAARQDEVRTILAIVSNFVVISPLTYDHVPPADDLPVHVANLTRNAVIESASTLLDHRGHVMFMHNRDVDVAYAGFYDFGRSNKAEVVNDPQVDGNWQLVDGTGTNPRARYSVHFHRNGSVDDGNPSRVHGSVVAGSPGWGFVNHSSYVEFTDNVSYDVLGAGFVSEVGDEIGSFHNNLAIYSEGSGDSERDREDQQDFGHAGSGFWFQGAGVSVTSNVASGHAGQAFAFWTRGLAQGSGGREEFLVANLLDPSIAGGEPTISVDHVPMRDFRDNVGYASSKGLLIRYHLRNATGGQQSIVTESTFYNNATGVTLPYTHNVVLRDLRIIRPFSLDAGTGVGHNLVTSNIVYEDLSIEGYRRGIDVPTVASALVVGGYFNNLDNIVVRPSTVDDRTVLITGDIAFGSFPSSVLGSQTQFDVVLRSSTVPIQESVDFLFASDAITLDFGPFDNQRVYFHQQQSDAVLFDSPAPDVPVQYVGLTTGQLRSVFGLTVGGELAPANAVELDGVYGLVAPAEN